MSVRYLHLIFEDTGDTVGHLIRDRRLQHAHRCLIDPGESGRTTEQIALAHGFASPSHFSRCYRARFGTTPSEARAAARLALISAST